MHFNCTEASSWDKPSDALTSDARWCTGTPQMKQKELTQSFKANPRASDCLKRFVTTCPKIQPTLMCRHTSEFIHICQRVLQQVVVERNVESATLHYSSIVPTLLSARIATALPSTCFSDVVYGSSADIGNTIQGCKHRRNEENPPQVVRV